VELSKLYAIPGDVGWYIRRSTFCSRARWAKPTSHRLHRVSDREKRKSAPREWDGAVAAVGVLVLETSRVSPPMELVDYVWCYLFLHPLRCRDKRVLRYLLMCLVTSPVVAVHEQLTNGALISSFIVSRAASWHIDTTSAPEHPSVCGGREEGSDVCEHENIPKVQSRKCQSQGRRSSWIDEPVEFLLCPEGLGDQRRPVGPVDPVSLEQSPGHGPGLQSRETEANW